jgi:hypothetical protein
MLKRTITLLSLTITVGALLLTLGCGGSNSNPVASVSSDQPLISRGGQPPSEPEMRIGATIWGYKYVGVRAVDPEGDRLKYKIVLQGPVTLVFDQSQGTGQWYTSPWSNTPVSDFASGQWGFVKLFNIPSGSYTISVQAFDGTSWSSNKSLSFNF